MLLRREGFVAVVVAACLLLVGVPCVAGAVEGESGSGFSDSVVGFVPARVSEGYFGSEVVEPGVAAEGQKSAVVSGEDANAQIAVVDLSAVSSVAGVTWSSVGDAPGVVWYRLFEGGSWGLWHEVRCEPGLGGTDPIVLAGVGALEVVVERTDVDVSLVVVDPDGGGLVGNSLTGVVGEGLVGDGPQSSLVEDESVADVDIDDDVDSGMDFGVSEPFEVSGVVVHDFEGSSGYEADQVSALLRAIREYQGVALGWGDVGYHFIVDRFGGVHEGREGSFEAVATGPYSLSNGAQSVDVGVLGNFAFDEASDVVLDGLVGAVEASLDLGAVDWDSELLVGDSGEPVSFGAVAGYRDVSESLSPGDGLYSRLGDLRQRLAVVDTDDAGDGVVEGAALPVVPEVRAASPSAGKWKAPSQIGHGWSGKVIYPGDWNRSGYPDLMRIDDEGDLYWYAGKAGQKFAGAKKIGNGWGNMTWVQGGVDWTGNGVNDILAINKSGDMYLYRGNGKGGFAGSQKIGNGWNTMKNIALANTSGGVSVYAVNSAGVLYRYPANGKGGFKSKVTYAGGWNARNLIVGVGDWNGDGYADFVSRATNGDLIFYPGRPGGGIASGVKIGNGWNIMAWVGAANQRGANTPLWAVDGSGRLLSYSFSSGGLGAYVAPLPARVSLKNGVYTFSMVHSNQQTNYWCGPASVFMVLERLGYVKSARNSSLWLSQSALASNDYLQTNRVGYTAWAQNNLVTGVAKWTGNKVKYTRQHAPNAAQLRARVSDSVKKTGRPIILDADEVSGGSHYNGHPAYSSFSHLMPVQAYTPGNDTMTILDPAEHYYAASKKSFTHSVGGFAPYLRAYGIYY